MMRRWFFLLVVMTAFSLLVRTPAGAYALVMQEQGSTFKGSACMTETTPYPLHAWLDFPALGISGPTVNEVYSLTATATGDSFARYNALGAQTASLVTSFAAPASDSVTVAYGWIEYLTSGYSYQDYHMAATPVSYSLASVLLDGSERVPTGNAPVLYRWLNYGPVLAGFTGDYSASTTPSAGYTDLGHITAVYHRGVISWQRSGTLWNWRLTAVESLWNAAGTAGRALESSGTLDATPTVVQITATLPTYANACYYSGDVLAYSGSSGRLDTRFSASVVGSTRVTTDTAVADTVLSGVGIVNVLQAFPSDTDTEPVSPLTAQLNDSPLLDLLPDGGREVADFMVGWIEGLIPDDLPNFLWFLDFASAPGGAD